MRDSHWSVIEVEHLARTQHGIVTRAQVAEIGVNPRMVSRLVAGGRWRAHLGVLLVPATDSILDVADAMALQLRLGPQSLVSGPTALRLQGLDVSHRLLVAWAPRPSMPRVAGVRILRDDLPRRVREIRGLRLAAPIDALLDTLISVTVPHARELLDLALQRRWLTADDWFDTVHVRLGRGRAGAARLRELGLSIAEGTHSDGERRCARLFRTAGITGWVANHVVRDQRGRPRAELDFAFPDLHLCVEIDGREAHSGPSAFERDRRRQNGLLLDGWTVLRFTWHQLVHEPEWVVAQVRSAMAMCAARPR